MEFLNENELILLSQAYTYDLITFSFPSEKEVYNEIDAILNGLLDKSLITAYTISITTEGQGTIKVILSVKGQNIMRMLWKLENALNHAILREIQQNY